MLSSDLYPGHVGMCPAIGCINLSKHFDLLAIERERIVSLNLGVSLY